MQKIDGKELHELFEKLKVKNKKAYEELYKKYSTLVYQIAFSVLKNKENAEDIMQNVFIKIANLPEEKLPSKYEASWLYTVTKNEAISYIRKNKENMPIEEVIQKSSEDEIEKMLGENEYNQMVSSLEDMEKQIISLKVDIGLSFKEIANLLNMPIGTVQWKYYKSLHSLKLLIGNLSLFIITFIITLSNFRKNKKDSIENEVIKGESNLDKEQEAIEKNDKQESATLQNDRIENDEFNQDKIEVQKEEINQEIKQEIIENSTNLTLKNIALIGVTSIFLCLTIFFTIIVANYQQKKRRKASKK